jgi:HAD superfamily hydrolase (TIGR01509 family)
VTTTNRIRTILFDWDGTLVDSATLGLTAFQKTFADLGVEFPLEIYETTYSPNWYTIYDALGVPKEKWQVVDDLWLAHYGDQLASLVDGVGETLLELRTRGYQLGVVSSGSERRISREIANSALHDCFEVVICNEHILNKKPHPEGLVLALQRVGCRSSEAAYVGDAPEDIQMGKRASVMTVGVRSAYPSSARIHAAAPDLLLESVVDLSLHFS